jgi:enoyl-CoA hydratase
MTSAAPLLVDQRGRTRWLRLNRPAQRNALNPEVICALNEQITLSEADPDTAVVAISGEGQSFCAGGDFRHFLQLHSEGRHPVEFLEQVSACFSRIEASPVPWVAALHGHVVAGGLELALVCDIVVATQSTLIGDGHVNNRLTPAAGSSVRLSDAVGRGLARRLLLTGELLPASDFAASGWIQAIVPDRELDATVAGFCAALSDRHSPAQARLKTLLHDIRGTIPERALAAELAAFKDNWPESSAAAALASFLNTRTSKAEMS